MPHLPREALELMLEQLQKELENLEEENNRLFDLVEEMAEESMAEELMEMVRHAPMLTEKDQIHPEISLALH